MYEILYPTYEGKLIPAERFDTLLINYARSNKLLEYDLDFSHLNLRVPFLGIVPDYDDGLDIGEQLTYVKSYPNNFLILSKFGTIYVL